MELIVESFGFRNGVPKGASVIFDARAKVRHRDIDKWGPCGCEFHGRGDA